MLVAVVLAVVALGVLSVAVAVAVAVVRRSRRKALTAFLEEAFASPRPSPSPRALRRPSPRARVLEAIEAQAQDLVFYDRKEDEDLPRGMLEDLLAADVISIEEMAAHYEAALRAQLEDGLEEEGDGCELEVMQ